MTQATVPDALVGAVEAAARALGSAVASVGQARGNPVGAPGVARRVARVALADGRVVAVKVSARDAPAAREAATLRFLHDRGASVAQPLAWGDDGDGWLATVWAGDVTLDAALAGASDAPVEALGLGLVEALATVEAAFAPLTAVGAPPGAVATAGELIAPWVEAAPPALEWLGVEARWASVAYVAASGEAAIASPLTVGPLDYHAGNVVTGASTTIVDLAAVGWDWPARRVAQYTFATGASPGGTFRSALARPVVEAAASMLALVHGGSKARWSEAIAAHAHVLVATAAWHLRGVATGRADPERMASWGDVDRRRASLKAVAESLAPLRPHRYLRQALALPSATPNHR